MIPSFIRDLNVQAFILVGLWVLLGWWPSTPSSWTAAEEAAGRKVRRGGTRRCLVRRHARPATAPDAPAEAAGQARRIPELIFSEATAAKGREQLLLPTLLLAYVVPALVIVPRGRRRDLQIRCHTCDAISAPGFSYMVSAPQLRQPAVDPARPRTAPRRGTPCSPAPAWLRHRRRSCTSAAVSTPPTETRTQPVAARAASQPAQHLERARLQRARRRARRPRRVGDRGSVRRPSREIVVLVAMMPSRPSSSASSATSSMSSSRQVRGDLHQQRDVPAGRASASSPTALSSGRSVSTSCSARRPGVFGELTLTTR